MRNIFVCIFAGVRQPAPWCAQRDAEQTNDPSNASRGGVSDGGDGEEEHGSCSPKWRFPTVKIENNTDAGWQRCCLPLDGHTSRTYVKEIRQGQPSMAFVKDSRQHYMLRISVNDIRQRQA